MVYPLSDLLNRLSKTYESIFEKGSIKKTAVNFWYNYSQLQVSEASLMLNLG